MSRGEIRYFCQTPLAALLPPVIAADAGLRAAAQACETQIKRGHAAIPDLLFFARLSEDSGFNSPVAMLLPLMRLAACAGGLQPLSDELLDLLAWQLHVEGYDLAQDRQAKVQIIQESLYLHRKKGTPWSLRRALELLMQRDVQIPEWFSYGGEPYYFRVRFDVSLLGFYPEQWRPLLSAIYEWKNVRSWLEGIWTYGITNMTHVFAAASRSLTQVRNRLWFPPPDIPATERQIAIGCRAFTKTRIPFRVPKIEPAQRLIASGIAAFTRSRIAA